MEGILDSASRRLKRRWRNKVIGWWERHPMLLFGARTGQRTVRWGKGVKTSRRMVTCAACGKSMDLNETEKHLRTCKARGIKQARREAREPQRRPATATAKAPPTPPAPTRTHRPAPTTNGGIPVSAKHTKETATLARAARQIGDMDPTTAWDLLAQVYGMAGALHSLSGAWGDYVENLDAVRVDQRVTTVMADHRNDLAELAVRVHRSAHKFAQLYAPYLEAAESGVRPVKREGFFDPKRSQAA